MADRAKHVERHLVSRVVVGGLVLVVLVGERRF